MAKESPNPAPGSSSTTTSKPHTKLPLLTKDQKISKRPLLHAPISSPRTSSSTQKIVYVSSSSPFISVVKRVRTYLDQIESRSAGKLSLDGGERRLLKGIERGINSTAGEGKRDEEVVVKGTGKAIEKVVRLAAWWGAQSDVKVVVRTGSVGAVDDIVSKDEEGVAGAGGEESRIRRVSCLEVGIRLR
ncbi:related to POP7 Nuclear RNase P subunit [Rhynchosporium graminicola]|uniref:Related to POP7 Nuclear RNase P subunit n=1 Tax=Rhynchosporium graminicola TaxID=2792576 RepID=A0A1E1LK75_9HELO|nr:related to POP7 Nuclear RNase P subunit [Rhynchosporium commune]